jgi:hypothetical protein
LAYSAFFSKLAARQTDRPHHLYNKKLKSIISRRHGGIFFPQGLTGQPGFTGLLVRQSIFLQTQRVPVPAGPGYSEEF